MTGLYALTAEQEALRASVRSALGGTAAARACYDEGAVAPDRALWARLADLGVAGLGVALDDGGSGGDVVDQLVVAEELGRAVAPVGFVGSAVAAAALGSAAPGPDRSRLLQGIASGAVVAGAVLDEPSLAYGCAGAEVIVVPVGDGVGWVEGAEVQLLPSVDRTRPVSACSWPPTAPVLVGAAGEPTGSTSATVQGLRDLQRTLYAAEAVGVAAAALERTAAYTRERRQFGLPIGTFQAVKHRLADMLVEVECARSAAYAAAWALRDGADARLPAHMAQAVATEAATEVVSAAIQLHGGIGVTWEHDLHLHLRRAKGLELATGSPGWHYEQLAVALLGPGATP